MFEKRIRYFSICSGLVFGLNLLINTVIGGNYFITERKLNHEVIRIQSARDFLSKFSEEEMAKEWREYLDELPAYKEEVLSKADFAREQKVKSFERGFIYGYISN